MEIKKYTPKNHYVKALVYGPSGTGKTTFGITAPGVVVASAESGLLSVAGKDFDFVDIKRLSDLEDLHSFLKSGNHNFKTVVIDSISEINEIIKEEKTKRQDIAWGEVSKAIRKIFRSFRDLPMHVLMIAQEKIMKDGDVIDMRCPSLNGQAATSIAYHMDIVGYMAITPAGNRKIFVEPNAKLLSKCRGGFVNNNTPVDFAEWVKLIQEIEILKEKEIPIEKEAENKSALVVPELSVIDVKEAFMVEGDTDLQFITEEQRAEILATWDTFWSFNRAKNPSNPAFEQKNNRATLDAVINKAIDGATSMKDIVPEMVDPLCMLISEKTSLLIKNA